MKILILWAKCAIIETSYAVITYHFKDYHPTTRGRENPMHESGFDSFYKWKPSHSLHIAQTFQNPTRTNGFILPSRLPVISRNAHWFPRA